MSKNKYMITRVQNRKPYNFKNIIQKDDGVLYFNYEEKIITQLVKSRDEDEFKAVCLRIQDFIEKENIDVCFVINQDELVDCLTEHQKLKLNIAELEHRLSNCIEPKFKIGQEVWYKPSFTLYSAKIESIKVHYRTSGKVQIQYVVTAPNGFKNHKNEEDLFATKEDVKSKLIGVK